MKDPSLFLFKNILSSKMRKGIQNFCHGTNSTSTLNQNISHDHNMPLYMTDPSVVGSCNNKTEGSSTLTLEQMILQLDLEEDAARRAKIEESHTFDIHRRMSCVNNSDILRSAQNALNQYPRFSLDGKDAMYRSSFRPVYCSRFCKERNYEERTIKMPQKLGGESVIWCKPSIVGKLMGLDMVPIPINGKNSKRKNNLNPSVNRKQNLRRLARKELDKERSCLLMHGSNKGKGIREGSGSTLAFGSSGAYCVTSPVEPVVREKEDWRFRRTR